MVERKQVKSALREGGQRIFHQAKAEIHEISGYNEEGSPKLERQTGAGMKTKVRQLLDPRLDLTDTQRAVGNCYGAFAQEKLYGGRGGEFLREYVDSTPTAGGGVSEAILHRSMMIDCADKALKAMPKFKYPVGKPRSAKFILGTHQPVSPLALVQMICRDERTLSFTALTYGWCRIRVEGGKFGTRKVPDRQRKALASHLADSIEVIRETWEDSGYAIPWEFMQVRVK